MNAEKSAAGGQPHPGFPILTFVIACLGLVLGAYSTYQSWKQENAKAKATVETRLDDAWTQLETGDLRGARLQVKLAQIQAPRNSRVLVFRGLVEKASNRWPRARQLFSEALTENPRSVSAHLHLGLLLLQRGKLNGANRQLREAKKLLDDSEETVEADRVAVLVGLGSLLLDPRQHTSLEEQARQSSEAGKLFAQALEIDPSNAKSLANMANYLAHERRWDEAVQDYCKAIRLEPNDPKLWTSLAAILYLQDDLDGAERAERRVIELQPRDPDTHKFLGLILFEKGETAEAALIEQEARHPYGFL